MGMVNHQLVDLLAIMTTWVLHLEAIMMMEVKITRIKEGSRGFKLLRIDVNKDMRLKTTTMELVEVEMVVSTKMILAEVTEMLLKVEEIIGVEMTKTINIQILQEVKTEDNQLDGNLTGMVKEIEMHVKAKLEKVDREDDENHCKITH